MLQLESIGKAIHLDPQLPIANASPVLATSVSARSKQPPPDCNTCGACCVLPLVVALTREDERRITSYCEVTAYGVVIERVLGRDHETGKCVHLDGTAGERVSCSIYPDRPHSCREFDAGSDRCLEFRRMCGIDTQLTDEELEIENAATLQTRSGFITDAAISVGSTRVSYKRADDGSFGLVASEKTEMRICVALDGNKTESIEIYVYDPEYEEWHESEFHGLTLDEALRLIEERKS